MIMIMIIHAVIGKAANDAGRMPSVNYNEDDGSLRSTLKARCNNDNGMSRKHVFLRI